MNSCILRPVAAAVLAAAVCGPHVSLLAAHPAAAQAQAAASLSGTATGAAGQTLANAVVQLRDLATGELAGSTTSGAAGQFSFVGLKPGNYAVEVVNAAGQVVGTSASVTVAGGAAVTGVTVGATAAAAAVGTAISTSVIVAAAAAAAGVTGLAVMAGSPSPSR